MIWLIGLAIEFACLMLARLGDLREAAGEFLLWYVAAAVVYGVLVWRLATLQGRLSRRALWLALTAACLFRITLIPSPPSLSDDIHRYLWDGRVQLAGINPYQYAPDAPALSGLRDDQFARLNHPSIPTVYPPLTQAVFRLGAWLHPTITTQKLLFLACDLGIVILLPALLTAYGIAPGWALLYAWHPLAIVEFAGSGHNDSLGILLLLAGLWAWRRNRKTAAALAWAGCFLAKFTSLLLVPWLAWRRQWKTLALFAAVVIVGYLPFLGTWRLVPGLGHTSGGWEFNSFLYGLLVAVWPSPSLARLVCVMTLAGWVIRRGRRDDDPAAYLLATLGAACLLTPVLEPWYVLWLVPLLCLYRRWSWWYLSLVVALSYEVLVNYVGRDAWVISPWVKWVEYGPFILLTAKSLNKADHRNTEAHQNTENPPSLVTSHQSLVTAIIPAYNEAAALPTVLTGLRRQGLREIIVVDNGSTDGTAAVAAAQGARVISEPRRGYGQACLSGIAALSPETDVVVFLDGDASDDVGELPRLVEPIIQDRADLIIGSRTLGHREAGSLTPQQRFGNGLACALIHLWWGHRYTDLGPFRAIRRDALEHLGMRDRAFGWTVEMQIKAIQQGLRIREVPVSYHRRIGRSKISGTLRGTVLAGWTIITTILRSRLAAHEP